MITSGFVEILLFFMVSLSYSNISRTWLLSIGALAGVYAQHIHSDTHITWSYLVFYSLIPVLVSYALVFWKASGALTAKSVYGFIVCTSDINFLVKLHSRGIGSGVGSIYEWVTVFTYLAWVFLVSLNLVKANH
jgi:hypothetical protein